MRASGIEPPSPLPTPDRRRFLGAVVVGLVLAAVPFAWLLFAGRLELQEHALGGFYDAQARSFLDGRWDVPREVLGFEAFIVDGEAYMYFGPVPALLRLPILAVTSALDGRLTQLSMLAAFATTLLVAGRLSLRIRGQLRGNEAVTTGEAVVVAGWTFLLGAGSSILYLASGAIVYHEAILWAIAFSLGAYDALLAHLLGGGRRALAVAGLLATLAFLTRGSVGAGPVVALALVVLVRAVGVVRNRSSSPDSSIVAGARGLVAPALAVVVPVALYAAVNLAKFETPFSVPFDAQVASLVDLDERQAFLDESGGTLFGARYAPTTVLQYVRVDALGIDRTFPWFDFPRLAPIIGDVRFDRVDRSSSLPVTSPWLVLLVGVGVVGLLRRRSPGARALGPALAPLVIGSIIGFGITVTIAYVANRYLADAVPVLVLLGLVGLHLLLGAGRRRLLLAGGLLLGVPALGVGLAHALLYQRTFGPPATQQTRAELVAWQLDADRLFPGDQAPELRRVGPGADLPERAPEAALAVVGDCAGVYQFDSPRWRVVEGDERIGHVRLAIDADRAVPDPGDRLELLAGGDDPARRSIAVVRQGDDIAFAYDPGGAEDDVVGDTVSVDGGEVVRVDVWADRRTGTLEVRRGQAVLLGARYVAPEDDLALSAPLGAVQALDVSAGVCSRLD